MLRFTSCCLFVTALAFGATTARAENSADDIGGATFGCLLEMTPVRGFFVANLHGDLDATLEVAAASTGPWPPGSVVQLVPGEAMVKREPGHSPATRDWEFFELDVTAEGTSIRARGFADVNNRFGGNCFACHVQAHPERDLICEQGHGCDPIPLTAAMTRALQKTDPRCSEKPALTEEEAQALADLQAAFGDS